MLYAYITNHYESYLFPYTVRLYSFAEAKSTFNLFQVNRIQPILIDAHAKQLGDWDGLA